MKDETIDPTARQLELLARAERRRQGSGHPTIRRLTAYHGGQLAEGEAEEVQDHLAVCRECTEALRELPLFLEVMTAAELAPDAGLVPKPAATEASWQALRARLALAPTSAAARREPVVETPLAAVPSRFPWFDAEPVPAWAAVAAGLLFCLGGVFFWLAIHRGTESRLLLAVSVPGKAEVMRGGESGRLLTARFEAEAALLALPLPSRPPFPAYRVEIRSPGGAVRLEATVTPTAVAAPPATGPVPAGPPPGLLTVIVASHQLPPGDYHVRILGVRDGRAEALTEYPLRVLAAELVH